MTAQADTEKQAQARQLVKDWIGCVAADGSVSGAACSAVDVIFDALAAHESRAQPASVPDVRVHSQLVGFVSREFSTNAGDVGEISKIQNERFAIPVYREMPPARLGNVGTLHVARDEYGTLFHPDFNDPDALPVGDHLLFIGPAQPASVPDEVSAALDVVNDAANDARHRGDYDRANALVKARIALWRVAQPASVDVLIDKIMRHPYNGTTLGHIICAEIPGDVLRTAMREALAAAHAAVNAGE